MPDRLASSAAAVSVGCLGEEAAPADALPRLRVLLPLPLPAALDYRVPAEMTSPEPGSFVRVPLGGRNLVGVVWGGAGGDVAADRLRPIAEILPARRLAPDLRRFIERVAAYTMAPPGAVLRMAMSVPEALHPPRLRRLCVPADVGLAALGPATPHGPDSPPSLTPARRRVLEVLRDGPPLPMAEVARLAGCSPGVIRDLVASGLRRGAPGRSRAHHRGAGLAAVRPGAVARPGERRAPPGRPGRGGRVWRDLARWRHRLGQDRNLLCRDRRSARRRPANPGAAAGDRARRAMAAALSPIALARHRHNGIPRSARPCAATPGAPSPTAGRGSSSAPARRCSCRSPSSD